MKSSQMGLCDGGTHGGRHKKEKRGNSAGSRRLSQGLSTWTSQLRLNPMTS
jgi:hypothetical protein